MGFRNRIGKSEINGCFHTVCLNTVFAMLPFQGWETVCVVPTSPAYVCEEDIGAVLHTSTRAHEIRVRHVDRC